MFPTMSNFFGFVLVTILVKVSMSLLANDREEIGEVI
jgi:hypothetical protein